MANIMVYSNGVLCFNDKKYRCAIGKNGIVKNKKEGDWKTPVGCFSIRKVLYRADKLKTLKTVFTTEEIRRDDIWCDDIKSLFYNTKIKLPFDGSYENLWREDNLYDLIVVLGYNDDPPIPGKGSAIFMHIARPNYSPTAGCIALNQEDLLEILKMSEKKTLVCVGEAPEFIRLV